MPKKQRKQYQLPQKVQLPTPEKERVTARDWDRMITDVLNRCRTVEKQTKEKGFLAAKDITDAYMSRRRETILRHLDEIYERYKEHDAKWLPNWIRGEFITLSLAFTSYSELESIHNWATAAAIWILDHTANDTETREKLYALLPRQPELLDDLYSFDFRDSRYDTDLILSVKYLIYNRNGNCEYDAHKHPRIGIPKPAGKGNQPPCTPLRKNFDVMMALIPKEEKEAAAEHLKKLYWVWLDHFYEILFPLVESHDYYQEQMLNNVVRYNQITEELKKADTSISKLPGEKLVAGKRSFLQPDFSLDQMLAMRTPLSAKLPTMDALYSFFERKMQEIDDLHDAYERLEEKDNLIYDEQSEKTMNFALESEDFIFEDIDPFELCFALLYLIEQDDDLPWLYGSCIGLMTSICKNLPWGIGHYDEENDRFWESNAKIENKKKYDVPSPDWNKRKYTSKGDTPRSMAQIAYELTGSLIPRDTHLYDGYYRSMKKYGVGSKDGSLLLTAMTTLATSEHKIPADNLDDWWTYDEAEDELDEVMKEADENEELVRQLRDQVKQLRISLHEAEKNARDAARELDLEKKDHEADRRELADLRELVFNREQNEQPEEPEPEEKEDLFPYEVKKTTLVFGGHDNWLKSIKLLLTGDIRFISKDQDAFDAGMLRKAEVIWLQPNCMSHKQFYKVMDHARQWKKQVRYFSNVSAVKSATQVMENDR